MNEQRVLFVVWWCRWWGYGWTIEGDTAYLFAPPPPFLVQFLLPEGGALTEDMLRRTMERMTLLAPRANVA